MKKENSFFFHFYFVSWRHPVDDLTGIWWLYDVTSSYLLIQILFDSMHTLMGKMVVHLVVTNTSIYFISASMFNFWIDCGLLDFRKIEHKLIRRLEPFSDFISPLLNLRATLVSGADGGSYYHLSF